MERMSLRSRKGVVAAALTETDPGVAPKVPRKGKVWWPSLQFSPLWAPGGTHSPTPRRRHGHVYFMSHREPPPPLPLAETKSPVTYVSEL